MSDGALPWLNIADRFLRQNCLLSLPIALATALVVLWAMTPFPLYSVHNDFDSPVFLFVTITSLSSILLDTSRRLDELMHIDSISCA